MKNILKSGLFVLLVAVLFTSCEEEETRYTDGAYPIVTDVINGFYNLSDIDNSTVGFTISETIGVPVNSITVLKSFNGSTPIEISTIQGNSGSLTVPATEAVEGFGVTTSDLVLGDAFQFTFTLNTSDGRALRAATTVDVPVNCESVLLEGAYNSVARGTSTDGCCPDEITGFTSVVNVTSLGGGVFNFDDFSGGIYLEWYSIYGLAATSDSPIDVADVCNSISSMADQTEPFGEWVELTGALDPSSGVISFAWNNGWGDEGDVVLTPQ